MYFIFLFMKKELPKKSPPWELNKNPHMQASMALTFIDGLLKITVVGDMVTIKK